jgi:hypothetical protein
MRIPRNANGIIDYCIAKVEQIDERDDIDIEKKATLGLAYLKEARGFVGANLAYKKLMIQAPDVARNAGIVLPIGSAATQIENGGESIQ